MNETQAKSDSNHNPNIHKEIHKNRKYNYDEKLKNEFDLQTKLQCYLVLNRSTYQLFIN